MVRSFKLEYGELRELTRYEVQLVMYPPDCPLDILRDLNTAEADAPVCEHCQDYHPLLAKAPIMTMYVNAEGEAPASLQPQPMLCPSCMEEWIAGWKERWAEYYSDIYTSVH